MGVVLASIVVVFIIFGLLYKCMLASSKPERARVFDSSQLDFTNMKSESQAIGGESIVTKIKGEYQ